MIMPRIEHSSGFGNPITTVDAIIEYYDGKNEGIVLITRKNPPYGLALPGGFAEGGLTLEQNVRKEAMEETGLNLIVEGDGPFGIFDDPERDPRGYMISIAYLGKGFGRLSAGDDAATARLYTIDEVKDLVSKEMLVFDHGKILQRYLEHRGYTNGT